jgi:hypothetical protein
MTTTPVVSIQGVHRYDRTLRVVMWMDAFLSVAMVVVCFFASPVVAIIGVPHGILLPVEVAIFVCALLLAAFGAITGVVLMMRMHAGVYYLPSELHLPLPPGLNPELVTSARSEP